MYWEIFLLLWMINGEIRFEVYREVKEACSHINDHKLDYPNIVFIGLELSDRYLRTQVGRVDCQKVK